jgi:hypothetical protein
VQQLPCYQEWLQLNELRYTHNVTGQFQYGDNDKLRTALQSSNLPIVIPTRKCTWQQQCVKIIDNYFNIGFDWIVFSEQIPMSDSVLINHTIELELAQLAQPKTTEVKQDL